jgi:Zn-dependent peptidase ImmA (M78 family)
VGWDFAGQDIVTSPKIWLSQDRIKEIRKAADDLLRSIRYGGGAVPIERIATEMGAMIRYAPYDGELAGMFIRSGDKSLIAVNSSHPKNRQRFTIAHECGHMRFHSSDLFVDKRFSILNRDEISSRAENIMEIEANQFAAEILMPHRYLISELKANNIDLEDDIHIKQISKKYMVSQQAMTYRIANLFLPRYIS